MVDKVTKLFALYFQRTVVRALTVSTAMNMKTISTVRAAILAVSDLPDMALQEVLPDCPQHQAS